MSFYGTRWSIVSVLLEPRVRILPRQAVDSEAARAHDPLRIFEGQCQFGPTGLARSLAEPALRHKDQKGSERLKFLVVHQPYLLALERVRRPDRHKPAPSEVDAGPAFPHKNALSRCGTEHSASNEA